MKCFRFAGVRHENDQRIVVKIIRLQVIDQPAHVIIQVVDLGRVQLHFSCFNPLFFRIQIFPRPDRVIAGGQGQETACYVHA
jgi:hypothetical protein